MAARSEAFSCVILPERDGLQEGKQAAFIDAIT